MHPEFLKVILGVTRVMGETGELPLAIVAAIRMIKYWHRLTTARVTDNCLAKLALHKLKILVTIALTGNLTFNIY